MRKQMHRLRVNFIRPAVSLVEILVVIAIVGVLAALAAWGAFAMIGGRQRANTIAEIQTINKLLQTRWAAVVADAKKESPSPCAVAMANGDAERARVIWIKARLAEAFPIAYAEVDPLNPHSIVNMNIQGMPMIPAAMQKPHFKKYQQILSMGQYTRATPGPNPFPPFPNAKPGYQQFFFFYPWVPGNPNEVYLVPPQPDPTESSACLLMALNTLQADGVSVNDQLKPYIGDTNGDGQMELIDAWGSPLTFFRFPWNNADLQAVNPAKNTRRGIKYADPLDSNGTLINETWYGMTPMPATYVNRGMFENTFHSVTTPNYDPAPGPNQSFPAPGTLQAAYTTPVIVSSGPDGATGLNPTVWKAHVFPQASILVTGSMYRISQDMSVASLASTTDNIVSFTLVSP